MKSKYTSLAKDTVIFSIGKFGSRLILFFLVPLYTNYLSQSEYGTADLVFTISQLLIPVFSIVIFDGVIRFGLSKNEKKENVLLNAVIILLFTVLLSIISVPLLGLYKAVADWRWFLVALIVLTVAMNIDMNYLKVKGFNIKYSLTSIIQTIVLASLNVLFLVKFSMGVKGYLLATTLSYLSAVVLSVVFGGVIKDLRNAEFKPSLFKEMLVYSAPLIINNISWWVIQSSDKLMLEAMISAAALGLYTAAAKIPSLINVLISIFQQAWGISSIKEVEDSTDLTFFSNIFSVFTTGVFLCCLLVNAIAKPFMSVYVGAEFAESWKFVPILVASAGFSAVSAYYGSIYGAIKKSMNNMLTTLCAALVNIVINYIFIKLVGIWGAMIGTIVSYVLISALRMIDIHRYVPFHVDVRIYILNAIIVIAHAILISCDFHVYITSVVFIILFALINKRTIVQILRKVATLLKGRRGNA